MRKEAFVSLALSYQDFPAIKYQGPLEGISPTGFDCSGFIQFLLKESGYYQPIPRHTNEFFDSFGILVHEQFRSPGDLVFFSYKGGLRPDHVGIMISKHNYIHSPGKNGQTVRIGNIFEQEIIEHNGNPLQIYSSNPIGFKRITVKNGRYQKVFLEG